MSSKKGVFSRAYILTNLPSVSELTIGLYYHQRQLDHLHKILRLHAAEKHTSSYGYITLISTIPSGLKVAGPLSCIHESADMTS